MNDLGPHYPTGIADLSKYQVYHKNQKSALDQVRRLAGSLKELLAGRSGIIWYGTKGTGKDHLAAALLYHAASLGQNARFVFGMSLFSQFRDGMAKECLEAETLGRYLNPEVLCISDPLPPLGELSPWNVQVLFRIVDGRQRAKRTTWATMNVADLEEAERRLSPPVFDRLRDRAEIIPCFWPSHRKELGR